MRWLRRRPAEGLLEDGRSAMAEAIGTTFAEDVDRLTARMLELDARMAQLEAQLADAAEAAVLVPDQDDLLDARVRSARLAADLHLVAIDLRSELQRLRPG